MIGARRMAGFWLAAAAACHLVVFSAVPLLHNHGGAPAAAPSAPPAPPCWNLAGNCLCRFLTGVSEYGRDRGGRAAAAAARTGGPCLACIYLQSTKSASPLDAARPGAAPPTLPAAGAPAAAELCRRLLSSEHPARAPPAA